MGWFSFIGQSKELEKVPIARIDPPTIGLIGEVITFNARDSYDPLGEGIASFHWDFGDGSTCKTSSALDLLGTFIFMSRLMMAGLQVSLSWLL